MTVVLTQLPIQRVRGGHLLSLSSTFTDTQGGQLSYSATLSDGTPLPSWLTLDAATGTLSGTAPAAARTITVLLTATGTSGGGVSESITIIDQGLDKPAVKSQTLAQTVYAHHVLSIATAAAFVDPILLPLTFTGALASGAALPAWLKLDATTGLLSGTAPSAGGPDLTVVLTATNTDGGSVSETFTISTPVDTPVAVQPAEQAVHGGRALSVAASFTDPLKEALTYKATMPDGTRLPSWLTLNAISGTLSGTAPLSAQKLSVVVTATNTDGNSASETILITDQGVDTPVVTAQTPTQRILGGHALSFSVAGAFLDPLGSTLSYSATLANRALLPSWLTLNAATGMFSGTVPSAAQSLNVLVTATNLDGIGVSETVTILGLGLDIPTLAAPTPVQQVFGGHALAFSAANAFSDPVGETLTYRAVMADSRALPTWLKLNATTGAVSGTAPFDAQTLRVVLTATNTDGGSASETVTIVDQGLDTPVVGSPTAAQSVLGGRLLSITAAAAFVDPGGQALTYTAGLVSGATLPPWIAFDSTTGAFFGITPTTAQTVRFVVTATNLDGGSASETVTVFDQGLDTPTLVAPTRPQSAVGGHALSFSVGDDFADPQGETLTYTSALADRTPLPAWLTLGPKTGVFSGTAPATAQTLSIIVTATNTDGGVASETLTVNGLGLDIPKLVTQTTAMSVLGTHALSISAASAFADLFAETLTYTATLGSGAALPSWLVLNGATGALTGVAPASAQTLNVVVTATNTDGGSASETIAIIAQGLDRPVVTVPSAAQLVRGGHMLSVSTASAFSDPAGEVLTYKALLASGGALPSWLSINPTTGTLTGKAPAAAQALTLMVTATNADGGSASETISITAQGTDTPKLISQTAAQSAYAGRLLAFSVAGAVIDPFGDRLTYSAGLADGTPLPAWLKLDPTTGAFSGKTPVTAQTWSVLLTATNTDGITASETIAITGLGLDKPALKVQTPALSILGGHTLAVAAANAFVDPLAETLTFTAILSNGATLPSWLVLNPTSGTFSGTAPATAQTLSLILTATNTDGGTASETIAITALGLDTPALKAPTPTQSVLSGHILSVPAATAFSDPFQETLTYKATLSGGAALPSWLALNPTTGVLSGTATAAVQLLSIVLTATNTDGGSASENFTINALGLDTPTLAAQTAPQAVSGGHVLSIAAAKAFLDPFNETLTYRAVLTGGASLPTWLAFNPTSGTLTVTAPSAAQTLSVILTATNTDGGSASETITITDLGLDTPVMIAQTVTQTVYSGQALSVSVAKAFSDPQGAALTYKAVLATGATLPSWLTLNAATGTLSGNAPAAVQTLNAVVTATNQDGRSASETVTITDLGLDTPNLTTPTAAQSVYGGRALSIAAAVAFSDPLGETLTYKLALAAGGAPPSWINFNAATGTISGTAPTTPQTLKLVLTATNTDGGSASETVAINALGVDTPTVISQTPAQLVYGGHTLSFSVANVFSDPLKETLTYTAGLAGGAALPSWLAFNPATLAFSGTARAEAQTLNVVISAVNTDGGSASETVTITDMGLDTPVVTLPTPLQSIYGGHNLAFSVTNVFNDPLGETLSYKASLATGGALPSWLTLDTTTLAFSGTAPAAAQTLNVVLVATNTDGRSASETVTIINQGSDIPILAVQTVDQVSFGGHAFNLAIPGNTFSDAAGEALTWKAAQSNGQALPSWLSFNASTATFSGVAPKLVSSTSVKLTATNTDGQSAAEVFVLNNRANAVKLAAQTANQTWSCGQKVSFAVPASTFVDAAGTALTYSANGTALPPGLSFNAANDSFSGTAPITPQTLSFKVTATDADGLTCAETFSVFIKAAAPTVNSKTANQTLIDGQKFSIPLASAFSDPQGAVLTFAADEISGPNATSWLHLTNGLLSGTVPTTGSGALGIRVTATNTFGLAASETFGLAYAPFGISAPSAVFTDASAAVEKLKLHA